MASSNWGAEDANRAYSQRVDREQRRTKAIRQARAAASASRGKRSV